MAREPLATALLFNELARTFDQGGGADKHLGQRRRVRYRVLAGELPADVGQRVDGHARRFPVTGAGVIAKKEVRDDRLGEFPRASKPALAAVVAPLQCAPRMIPFCPSE